MKKRRIIFWLIALFPLFVTAAAFPFLPAEIPLRWCSCTAHCWAAKLPSVFLIPLTTLFISGIAALLPHLGDGSAPRYPRASFAVALFGALLACATLVLTCACAR